MNTTIKQLQSKYSDQYLIYTRKSTDDAENQKNSIGYQTLEGKRYVERTGLSLAKITIESFCIDGVIEEHHSGFKQDYDFETHADSTITYKVLRPKFLTLINLLKSKEIKGVICLCWDRISRNESDDVLIKKLISQGVDVRFAQASYDDTSSGALHMDIDGMFSRHYSRVISEKVKISAKKLLAEGRCIYNSPIGYLDKGSDNKPFDPIRAPLVKRIFELYATGEWSFYSLAHWANQQGLTTKPARRKRTREEKARGVEPDSIPKAARPVTNKNIEIILRNPFYIGKNIHNGKWIDCKAHKPLIDTALFFKVQSIMKSKTVTAHYPHLLFYTYRGILRCKSCQRVYTPYEQKGIAYYRSNCKRNCGNKHRNINDEYITRKVTALLSKIAFSEGEIKILHSHAEKELNIVNERRNKEVEDLFRQLNKAFADLDYLIKDKLNLLRTGVFSASQVIEEEVRLQAVIDELQLRINANKESASALLEYIMTFSKLVSDVTTYFAFALDSEKRAIVKQVFSELYVDGGELKYVAKEGYNDLLKRFDDQNWLSGCPHYIFYELAEITRNIKPAVALLSAFRIPLRCAA